MLIGGVVLTYGKDVKYLGALIAVGAALGLSQLLLSGLSVIFGWPEALEYSLDSATENRALSEKFRGLGITATDPLPDTEASIRELIATDEARRKQDARRSVSDGELRRGHRAALRQFQKECVECKNVPTDMSSTDCNVCGRFSWKRK